MAKLQAFVGTHLARLVQAVHGAAMEAVHNQRLRLSYIAVTYARKLNFALQRNLWMLQLQF
jgi:hypothetical protein